MTHDGIIIERGKESYCLPLHPCGWSFVACLRLYSVPFFAAIHLAIPIRNRLRRRRGLCPHCRYDRRGLPPGSACPECGRGASTPVR